MEHSRVKSRQNEPRRVYTGAELKRGVRGKYLQRYSAGTNLIRLDADVLTAFPNKKAVNDALRLLLNVARKAVGNKSARIG